jgi:hypothetical protein
MENPVCKFLDRQPNLKRFNKERASIFLGAKIYPFCEALHKHAAKHSALQPGDRRRRMSNVWRMQWRQ